MLRSVLVEARGRTGVKRASAGPVLAVLLLASGSGSPAAAVTIDPLRVAPGVSDTVSFTVRSQLEGARLVEVTILVPVETSPGLTVAGIPARGWRVRNDKVTFPRPQQVGGKPVTTAVGSVTWTVQGQDGGAAAATGIERGDTGTFFMTVDTPKGESTLPFGVLQTYSDGRQVRRLAGMPSGDPAAKSAPQLVVSKTRSTVAGAVASPAVTEVTPAPQATPLAPDRAADVTAQGRLPLRGTLWPAVAGVQLVLLVLLVVHLALRRRRETLLY